jgi:hypothetical protein
VPIRFTRRWTSALLIVLCLAAVFALTPLRVVPLRWAGHALVRVDPLVRADIAIVPEWTGAAGALEVADLIQAGMVDRVGVLATPVLPEEREFRRRGIPYDDNPSDRGLIFVSYQSSIQNQFEFVSQQWANREDLPVKPPGDGNSGFDAQVSSTAIGNAVNLRSPYDLDVTAAVRGALGDWRALTELPAPVFDNPAERSDFYIGLGFNASLTDFPAPAFHCRLIQAAAEAAPTPPHRQPAQCEASSR